jgi:fucose permease
MPRVVCDPGVFMNRDLEGASNSRAFALLAAGILTVGYLASETGVVLPNLAASYGLSPDQQGLVVSIRFLGSVIAGLFLLFVGARVRYVTYLLTGAALNLSTVFLLFLGNSYGTVLAVSLLRGLCLTATITSTNGALEAWFAGGKAGRSNRVHAFFGIGLMLAPLVALVSGRLGLGWKAVWAAPSLGAAVVLALYPRAARTVPRPNRADTSEAGSTPRWDPRLLVAVGVAVSMAFFNVGVEAVILGWTPMILGGYGAGTALGAIGPAAIISLVLSAGVFAGRRSAAKLVARLKPPRYYVVSAGLLAACGTLAASSAGSAGIQWIHVALAAALGLSMSALYPVLVSRIGTLGTRTGGRVFAAFELGAASGGTVFPALVGWIGGDRPAPTYATVLVVGALVLVGFSVLLRRLLRRLGTDRD